MQLIESDEIDNLLEDQELSLKKAGSRPAI